MPFRPNVDPNPLVRQPGFQGGPPNPIQPAPAQTGTPTGYAPPQRMTPVGPPGARDPNNPGQNPHGSPSLDPSRWSFHTGPGGQQYWTDGTYTFPGTQYDPPWKRLQQEQHAMDGLTGTGLVMPYRPTHAAYGSQGGRPGFAPGPVGSASYGGGMSVGSGGGGSQQEQLAMLLQQLMGQGG